MDGLDDLASQNNSPEFRGLDLDDQSDPGFGDIVGDFDVYSSGPVAHQDEVDRWNQLPMEDKWEDVMGLLQHRTAPCRWDAYCGDSKVTSFLEGYKKEGLKIKDDREVRSPTVLHMLARNFDKNGFAGLDEQSKQRIINFLLDHRKNESDSQASLKTKSSEDPIFIVALRYDNKDFIQFLLSNCPDSVKDLLHASDEERTNTLHHIFRVHFPKAIQDYFRKNTPMKRLDLKNTYKLAVSFAKIASAKTIAAQDKDGNTPLHYALDYTLCRIPTDTHQKLVFQMIEAADKFLREDANKGNQFNHMEDSESPYLYFLRTKRKFLDTLPNKASSTLPAQAAPWGRSVAQESMLRDPKTKAYAPKDGVASRAAKADEHSRGGLEASMEMRYRGASAKEYVEKGKTTPFSSDEKARSGYDEQPPKDIPFEAKESGLLGNRNVHDFARRPTLRTQSPDPFSARNPESVVQSSPADVVSAVQIPAVSSRPDVSSEQHGKARHVTGTSSLERTASSSHIPEDEAKYKHAAEQIRHRLKLHYIRTRSDIDAKDLLYGKIASDKNLYFDATHLEGRNSTAMAELVNMLSQPGGFEDTLSYVYLPCLSRDEGKLTDQDPTSKQQVANQGRQRVSKPENNFSTGRDSLIAVFDTLAKARVKNILHLQVDDMYDSGMYHTDAAIERSIRGADRFFTDIKRTEGAIDIETWDWIKPDLSIDVIAFAAPNVVKINLYWSGNQTVLRAWARKKGVPGLYHDQGKKLRTLVLHAAPGIESAKRMEKVRNEFKNEINTRTEGGINVVILDWNMNKAAGSQADSQLRDSAAGQSQTPPDHDWVKSMENFRRSLLSIHRTMPKEIQPRRIKVALIDDGVHLSSLNTYNKSVQVTGLSYWTPKVSAEGTFIGQSWHQSTRGHGTIMANMLVRVNPWVILHVIRIQDQDDNSFNGAGPIKIHAESAAKAIRAAIIRDVDIISMSWTVRDVLNRDASTKAPNRYEEQSIEALKKAIDAARSKNIIMFCSASDEIKLRSTDSLPYAQAQGYIFRIGAAGPSGQRDMMSEDQQHINWFFPGNQVAEANDPLSKKILEFHSGSSVSTALAAGLASLVMYLPRLMQTYHEHTDGKDSDAALKFAGYAAKLRTRENMKRAFDNITDQSHEDKKFLPVWHLFGRRADRIMDSQALGARSNKSWVVLEELVTDLCSKLIP